MELYYVGCCMRKEGKSIPGKGKGGAMTGPCQGTWTVVETIQGSLCLQLVGKEVGEEDNRWDLCKVPYGTL